MEIEFLLNSTEYKEMKKQYEKKYFKLFGKYCQYTRDKVNERTASEMSEYFKNKKVSVKIVHEETTKKGDKITKTKVISKTFYEVWSNDPDMLEFEEITFDCDVKKVPKTTYNLFTGFTHFDDIKFEEVDLTPIFDLLKSLVDYNEFNYNYFLNWLAHIVHRPEKLPDTSLIFISKEGVGKDLFYQLMSGSLGKHYCENTDKLEKIVGQFNGAIAGKLFFACNETNPIESAQRIENIKALITAKELLIEEKYKNAIKCKNFCRIVFFSNNLFAFPVDENSRRPVIFKCSEKYLPDNYGAKESEAHFKKLADMIEDEKYQHAFLRFLQKRDISKWNPKIYEKTRLHETLIEVSIKPIVAYLARLVEEYKNQEVYQIDSSHSLADFTLYLRENNYKFDYTPKKFTAELKMDFGVDIKRSSQASIQVFHIQKLKEILIKKYKYNFDTPNNNDSDIIVPQLKSHLDNGIVVEDTKDKQIKELQEKIKLLEQQLTLQQNINKPNKIEKIDDDDDISEEDLEKELNSILSGEKKVQPPNYMEITSNDIDDILNCITTNINNDKTFKVKKNKSKI